MKKIGVIIIISIQFILSQNGDGQFFERHVLIGGTAHIGNGDVIENSTVIIEKGKIVAVGPSELVIVNKKRANIYNIEGKHVYPAFILPNSTLGLAEIDAVRATRDEREVGVLNPNVRTQIAYNTESIVASTIRSNGILFAQITPRGGLIAGTSSIMKLDGWNWEDATYLKDDGIHLYWPELYNHDYWAHNHSFTSGDISDENKKQQKVLKSVNLLIDFFEEARQYNNLKTKETDLRLESLRDLFAGKKTLYIHVNGANSIKEAVLFAKNYGVKKVVLVGASESWRITDFIVNNNIPIILGRIHRLPNHKDDDIDQPYKTPKILKEAGILFCLDYHGDMERMGSRNLPFLAGTATTYGLTKEESLELITLNPAKILGIDNLTGSLETGKEANLFISSGDALDMLSHNIEILFLMGKELTLENHQTKLYNKYLEKFDLKK